MKALWECYAKGYVSKDDLTATLRAHQAAVDATEGGSGKLLKSKINKSKENKLEDA
jgi:hypothetical protein